MFHSMADFKEENQTMTLTIPTQGSIAVISLNNWIFFVQRYVAYRAGLTGTWRGTITRTDSDRAARRTSGSSTSMTRPKATSCMSTDTSPETMAELCAYEIPINRPYLTLIVNIHTHAQSAAKIQYYWLFVIWVCAQCVASFNAMRGSMSLIMANIGNIAPMLAQYT